MRVVDFLRFHCGKKSLPALHNPFVDSSTGVSEFVGSLDLCDARREHDRRMHDVIRHYAGLCLVDMGPFMMGVPIIIEKASNLVQSLGRAVSDCGIPLPRTIRNRRQEDLY